MPVHSELLVRAICIRLALYCSPLGHNLFLPRDIVVTLHRMRAHTTLWSFLMPHCTPVRPRVATPGEMNMHFLPVSPGPSVLPIPTATAHPNLQQRWDASLLAVMQCIAAQRASTLEAQLPQINQCGLCVGLQTHHSCTRAGPHARAGVANRPSRDDCCRTSRAWANQWGGRRRNSRGKRRVTYQRTRLIKPWPALATARPLR